MIKNNTKKISQIFTTIFTLILVSSLAFSADTLYPNQKNESLFIGTQEGTGLEFIFYPAHATNPTQETILATSYNCKSPYSYQGGRCVYGSSILTGGYQEQVFCYSSTPKSVRTVGNVVQNFVNYDQACSSFFGANYTFVSDSVQNPLTHVSKYPAYVTNGFLTLTQSFAYCHPSNPSSINNNAGIKFKEIICSNLKNLSDSNVPGVGPIDVDAPPVYDTTHDLPPKIYPSHCSNNVKDSDESDIDCGGECRKCPSDKQCSTNSDCISSSCVGGQCVLTTQLIETTGQSYLLNDGTVFKNWQPLGKHYEVYSNEGNLDRSILLNLSNEYSGFFQNIESDFQNNSLFFYEVDLQTITSVSGNLFLEIVAYGENNYYQKILSVNLTQKINENPTIQRIPVKGFTDRLTQNATSLKYIVNASSFTGVIKFDNLQFSQSDTEISYSIYEEPTSCCPKDYCWKFNTCVRGRNETELYTTDSNEVFSNRGNNFYACIRNDTNNVSDWVKAYLKDDWDYETTGVCLKESDCWNKQSCVKHNWYDVSFGNHICYDGSWTTRTKLLALAMLNYSNKHYANNYVLYCDNFSLASPYINNTDALFLESLKSSTCVLRLGDLDSQSALAEEPDKIIIGFSLNGTYNSQIDLKKITGISNCDGVNGQWVDCGLQKVWYNKDYNLLVYSKDYNLVQFSETSFLSTLWQYLTSPIKMFTLPTTEPTEKQLDLLNLINKTKDFDRVFVASRYNVNYFGVIEKVKNDEIMYLDVFNVTGNMCEKIDNYNITVSGTEYNKQYYCNTLDESNSKRYLVVTDRDVIKNTWQDLTSKIRFKP